MAVVVAGLFDSEVDATRAMDRLLREDIEGLDTHVINGSARTGADTPNTVIPIIPNTSGGPSSGTIGGIGNMGGVATSGAFGGWLDDMDEVEQGFYQEAMREGSTLALARVDEEHADKVRLIFSTFGSRTYTKD